MRIVHIIESLEFGGAEKVVVSLANSMASGNEVMVCCLKRLGPLAVELDGRIRVVCMDKREGNDYVLPFRLARILGQECFDVVHTHNWGVFLEGGLAGVLARVPVLVHTVHGPYADYGSSRSARIKLWLRHFVERIASSRFSGIAAVSEAVAAYIVKDIGIRPDKVFTVHNGIPVAEDHTTPARVERPRTDFITVGRLAAIKNHRLMLQALRGVLDAGVPARLVIVGDGPELDRIRASIEELGLGEAVHLPGFRSDVADLLDDADIFVMSSRYEGISIAMLEAMRSALPVISTRVGGVPETVLDGETGVLVEDNNLAQMTEAMLRLACCADLRRKMGARGRQFLNEEFSLSRMTGRYLRMYQPSTL